jgi:hypothetical protein
VTESLSETSLLQHLEDLAARMEIDVRYESLVDEEISVHSGGCKLSGRRIIFVDLRHTPGEKARILARELSRYDLENFYLPPRVREFILRQESSLEKNLPQR